MVTLGQVDAVSKPPAQSPRAVPMYAAGLRVCPQQYNNGSAFSIIASS